MQPELVDGGQFVPKSLVQVLDNPGITLHGRSPEHQLLRVARRRHLASFGGSLELACRVSGQEISHSAEQACFWASASSMMARIVVAQRPHCGPQPRQR